MKAPILISSLILFACNDTQQSAAQTSIDSSEVKLEPPTVHSAPAKVTTPAMDTTRPSGTVWVDKLTGITYPLPDTIAGRPISFYLNHSKVASIAKSLYTGKFRPEDNDTTTQLLSLVMTDDSTIRPFYRWCLNFTIQITDGALGEYPGEPALDYATKFPQEFFAYMDRDSSGQRYNEWTAIIAYSGLPDYTQNAYVIEEQITIKMLTNCKDCKNDIKGRIRTFAKDITEAAKIKIDLVL